MMWQTKMLVPKPMTQTNLLHSNITLHGLTLTVYLGWPQAERLHEQQVTLDAKIVFPQLPPACTSDDLNDTFCYDTLISAIKQKINSQKFRLLEHLGHEIYRTIKTLAPKEAKIQLSVNKQP